MSGLDEFGFTRKRLIDIKTEIEDKLKLAFGENIDLTPQSGFGQIIGIFSESISDQWEQMENVYNAMYPSTAQGNQLSNVVMFNGIERQNATNSTVTATIYGTSGTVIPVGSKASVVSTGDIFVTLAEVTIGSGGTVDVAMESEEEGEIEVVTGTLTVIESPIFGWTSITNPLDAIPGRNEETDSELRIRRVQSTQALGQNLVDSLYGQLLNVDDVLDAVVISNGTDAVVDGIPAHSFESYVLGGTDIDVAEVIWRNTPQGIASFGTTTVYHTDAQGFPQPVKLTRPADVNIYFKLDITVDGTFPGTGEDNIKAAMVAYGIANYKISDDVVYSRFYCPINSVDGVTSISMTMDTVDPPVGTSNIAIDNDEISRFDVSRITINII